MRELSEREMQILRLIAEGNTDRDIAEQFGTAYYTVRTQRNTILVKMGAKNIAHAVALAYQRGLFAHEQEAML